MVVSKYIDNPLLINGHKSDLRLYVLVTSYDPLIIYLYEEGLVRFATVKYDNSGQNLWNPCMHLCNYSINKYHSDYIKSQDPDVDDQGHKWSLSAFLKHLKANNIDTTQLMQSIEDVIVKSIISVEFSVNSACKMFVLHRNNCFELYGFDILVDSDLKPWLIEVNLSPSLNTESPIDMKIKSAMMSDLLTVIGIPAIDPVLKRAQFNQKMNNLTAEENSKKFNKRNISAEGRRHSAIRLATTTSSEFSSMIRDAKEQDSRRRGWVRIFPTSESWNIYGALLEYGSSNNLILHEHLFPGMMRKPASRMRTRLGENKNRGKSAMQNKEEQSLEMLSENRETLSPRQLRVAQYEKHLSKGHKAPLKNKSIKDSDKTEKEYSENKVKSGALKVKIMQMIESGVQLSEYQARKAFTIYLLCILKKLSDFNEDCLETKEIEVVLKFLQKVSIYFIFSCKIKRCLQGKSINNHFISDEVQYCI